MHKYIFYCSVGPYTNLKFLILTCTCAAILRITSLLQVSDSAIYISCRDVVEDTRPISNCVMQ